MGIRSREPLHYKDSGSPPQAVNPYTQANAQYGLSTGTALFNAGLNRTNSSNPLGSSTWNASYGGAPTSGGGQVVNPNNLPPGWSYAPSSTPAGMSSGLTGPSASGPGATLSNGASQNGYSLGGSGIPTGGSSGQPYNGSASGGAPTYSQTTSLTPWANQMLSNPVDTSGLPGMPGSQSIQDNLKQTQDAVYNQNEAYLQPQQALANEALTSQLANQEVMPGSEAYKNAMDQQNRNNTFQNQQAQNAAVTAGNQEQATLYGLGTQGLQNQLALRNAPISEYQALSGNGGAAASAQTPDISGAFAQQLQSQLAGYNANVASNNATTGDLTSAAMMAAMYFMM